MIFFGIIFKFISHFLIPGVWLFEDIFIVNTILNYILCKNLNS